MLIRLLALAFVVAAVLPGMASAASSETEYSVIVHDADLLQMPGACHPGWDINAANEVDCNSPAHWDGATMYLFNSAFHPFRTLGADIYHLARPSHRVNFDNEAGWKMGGRWIEATYKPKNGLLYMWYHNEPPIMPGKTAPHIGAMTSTDNGLNWHDAGIILEAPDGSNNLETINHYFVGGIGDLCVVPDKKQEFLYFFVSTYNKNVEEQGIAVARMRRKDCNDPVGKVSKWYKGRWDEPGLGGHVTPIFPAAVDWHRADVDTFWGPAVHYNTYLNAWVMLLNRAIDKDWAQEGIYVSFNKDIAKPGGWTKPVKILDAAKLEKSKWYPQVIGTNTAKHETDKMAGRTARLFVAGYSRWEIEFLKSGKKPSTQENK